MKIMWDETIHKLVFILKILNNKSITYEVKFSQGFEILKQYAAFL